MFEETKTTTSRNDFIEHSIHIAQSMDPFEFWQRGELIRWNTHKKHGFGRSLMVEAAMKTWLDGYNPEDLYKQSPVLCMFLETEPGSATERYTKIEGTCQGHPVCLVFDRVTRPKTDYNIQKSFWEHAGHRIQNGVIFYNQARDTKQQPTVSVFMSRTDRSYDKMKDIENPLHPEHHIFRNLTPHHDLYWEYEIEVNKHPALKTL